MGERNLNGLKSDGMSSEWKDLAVKGRGKRGSSGGWRRWFKGGENMFREGREANRGSETGEGLPVGE